MCSLDDWVNFAEGGLGEAIGVVEADKEDEEGANTVLDDTHVFRIELAHRSVESAEAHHWEKNDNQLNRTKHIKKLLWFKVDCQR